jgi:pseudomonalisin
MCGHSRWTVRDPCGSRSNVYRLCLKTCCWVDFAARKLVGLGATLILAFPFVGAAHGSESAIVALRGRDPGGLRVLLAAQQDPASPAYHRWLTPAEFGARFGPAPPDLHRVERWLRDRGCRVKRYSGLQQVACMGVWPGPLPDDLRSVVEDVLDPTTPLPLRYDLVAPDEPRSTLTDGSFFFAPHEYAEFFDFADLLAAGIDGSGQRIGIVGTAPVDPDDVALFRSQFGLPALDLEQAARSDRPPPSPSKEGLLEALLDVTWSGAVAPGAGVVLAISSNALVDAIGYLVSRSDVSVISLSVGLIPSARTSPFIKHARRLFKQAAVQGQTVLVASGDHGVLFQVKPKRRGINPFATSPFVTGVGGTTPSPIDPTDADAYGSEVVWQDGDDASGGGRSSVRRPSWQRGSPTRTVPDVALPAAPVYPLFQGGGFTCCAGGTSAGAPAWAGLVALLNQQRGTRAGLLNPMLYDLGRAQKAGGPKVFHDIVEGSSTTPLARGFPAKPGYDLATGWGTPDVGVLFANLH